MFVAICDDEPVLCKQLRDLIYTYSNLHNLDTLVEVFYSGSSFLSQQRQYDIVFLDYQMPGLNGLQTADVIRKHNKTCIIIFLTSFPEIVYDTFLYETFRFLLKPLNKDKLFEALDSYRKKVDLYYPISVNISGEIYKVNTKDIVYIEADGKSCTLRLVDKSLHCAKTLSRVLPLLPSNCFFKSHRSYIVNLAFIEKYDKKFIRFTNGEYAKISRDSYSNFKKALTIFLNDNYI